MHKSLHEWISTFISTVKVKPILKYYKNITKRISCCEIVLYYQGKILSKELFRDIKDFLKLSLFNKCGKVLIWKKKEV